MRPWLRLVPVSAVVAVISAVASPANPGPRAMPAQGVPKPLSPSRGAWRSKLNRVSLVVGRQ